MYNIYNLINNHYFLIIIALLYLIYNLILIIFSLKKGEIIDVE